MKIIPQTYGPTQCGREWEGAETPIHAWGLNVVAYALRAVERGEKENNPILTEGTEEQDEMIVSYIKTFLSYSLNHLLKA